MTSEHVQKRSHHFPMATCPAFHKSPSLIPIMWREAVLTYSSILPTFPHRIPQLRNTLSFSVPTVNQIDKLLKFQC